MAAAEVRIFSYSGKLGLPLGVRASARRRPPVSAITGGINPRYPGRVRIHLRAWCWWIQKEVSMAADGPNSTAKPLREGLFELNPRRKVPQRGLASMPEHPLRPAGLWWKPCAPYTQHTMTDGRKQFRG